MDESGKEQGMIWKNENQFRLKEVTSDATVFPVFHYGNRIKYCHISTNLNTSTKIFFDLFNKSFARENSHLPDARNFPYINDIWFKGSSSGNFKNLNTQPDKRFNQDREQFSKKIRRKLNWPHVVKFVSKVKSLRSAVFPHPFIAPLCAKCKTFSHCPFSYNANLTNRTTHFFVCPCGGKMKIFSTIHSHSNSEPMDFQTFTSRRPAFIAAVDLLRSPRSLLPFGQVSINQRSTVTAEPPTIGGIAGIEDERDRNEELETSKGRDDVLKLKRMLEQMESVLKEGSEAAETGASEDGGGLLSCKTLNKTSADSIKEKIDKMAIPILTQISEDLSQQFKNNTSKKGSKLTKAPGKKTHPSKCDRACSPEGLWFSNFVGSEINITILPNMMLKVGVKPIRKNGFLNKNWFMQGLTLSKRGGPLMLAAVCPQKKKIASFIGQCKVCQAEDLIFGIWTISSCASRCCDVWTAVETKTDVLRRRRQRRF